MPPAEVDEAQAQTKSATVLFINSLSSGMTRINDVVKKQLPQKAVSNHGNISLITRKSWPNPIEFECIWSHVCRPSERRLSAHAYLSPSHHEPRLH
jgi:hypothetical protein